MSINDINSLISREITRSVEAVLETKLSSDGDEEKKRQERMAQSVKDRGIVSDSDENRKTQDEVEKEDEDKGEKREDRTGGKGTADSPKLKMPKEKVLKAPTLGSIIDKLNALRGGKSLKDPDVKESFEQYFEGLSTSERQTLLAFMTGIAQILTGVEKGSEALEPKDIGVKTKAQKTDSQKIPEKGTEDTSGRGTADSPIIVGEVYDFERALKAYRKNT